MEDRYGRYSPDNLSYTYYIITFYSFKINLFKLQNNSRSKGFSYPYRLFYFKNNFIIKKGY